MQTSIHAEPGSHHETLEEALAAIEEMIREGVAELGEFNVREIDAAGRTVRVIEIEPAAGAA